MVFREEEAHTPKRKEKMIARGIYAVYEDNDGNKFFVPISSLERSKGSGALHVADGSADWQYVTVDAAASFVWTCPVGVYEIFVSPTAGDTIMLSNADQTVMGAIMWDGSSSMVVGGLWLPATSTLWGYKPAGAAVEYGIQLTSAHGLRLSTGELLIGTVDFYVRFRRIG